MPNQHPAPTNCHESDTPLCYSHTCRLRLEPGGRILGLCPFYPPLGWTLAVASFWFWHSCWPREEPVERTYARLPTDAGNNPAMRSRSTPLQRRPRSRYHGALLEGRREWRQWQRRLLAVVWSGRKRLEQRDRRCPVRCSAPPQKNKQKKKISFQRREAYFLSKADLNIILIHVQLWHRLH